MVQPHLLSPDEYLRDAISAINNAEKSISFVSLLVADDEATEEFITALRRAAERGVAVSMAADIFTFGEYGGHFTPMKFFAQKSRQTQRMVRILTKAGVQFTWLGRFSISPLTGRNHMKCLVVDDHIFSFGGVNMDGDSLGFADYMFSIRDRQAADSLSDVIKRITMADKKHFSYRSHRFDIDKHSTALIDGGLQGDSVIYRRVCKLVAEAESVLYVSQYCPTGKLSKLLGQRSSRLYFNNPEFTNNKLNSMAIRLNMALSGNKTLYTRENYLHAKFIIATMKNKQKIAITGSHNFTNASVLLGTREIALETKNPRVIKQLEEFFTTHVQ